MFALVDNLGKFLRGLALPESGKKWSPRTLREKLIKIGAKVVTGLLDDVCIYDRAVTSTVPDVPVNKVERFRASVNHQK